MQVMNYFSVTALIVLLAFFSIVLLAFCSIVLLISTLPLAFIVLFSSFLP